MAITFVANGGYNNGTTSVVLTKPTGTAQNDLMLMFVNVQNDGSAGTVTTPSGWTYVTDTGGSKDDLSTFWDRLYLFWKIAGSSEPSTYTVSDSGSVGSDGDIRTYRGTGTSNPINSSQTKAQTTGSTTVVVPVFSETFDSGERYVGCTSSLYNAVPTSASPALSNVYSDTGTWTSFYLGDYAPSGVPGAETYTYGITVSGTQSIGVTIVVPQTAVFVPNAPVVIWAG